MVKTETLNKYELMLVVDAKLTADQKEQISKEVTDTLLKHKAKVINSKVWLERHKFTFPIKRQAEGTYYLINFESDGSSNVKINNDFRLNEKILRYIIIDSESTQALK